MTGLGFGQLAPAVTPMKYNQWGFTDSFLNDLVPAGMSGTGGQVVNPSQWGFTDAQLDSFMDWEPPTATTGGGSWFDGWGDSEFWLGNSKTGAKGAAMPMLAAAGGLMNGWLGFEQLGLAKDQLAENKHQFALNFNNQASLTNTNLRDRQQARIGAGSNAQSVDSYMKENAVRYA